MRGQGRVFRPTWTDPQTGEMRTVKTWWLDYSLDGRRHREPAGTTSWRKANDLLRKRIQARRDGTLVESPDELRFAERDEQGELVGGLRGLVETQYVLDGNRSLKRAQIALGHMEKFFGVEAKAMAITPTRIDDYVKHRMAGGASRATCNYELSLLRRAYRLAVKKRLLAVRPEFEIPDAENARQGFLTEADMAALVVELPADVRPIVQFLYFTGWRVSEALNLTWLNVDREAETIRLSPAETKGKAGRVFPYGDAPSLKALMDARWAERDGPFVFHRAGKPIRSFRRAWARACKRAGLDGRLVHDLRRSAAREFRRAGLSETDVMELAGWRTPAMFRRYAIKDEAHLEAQVGKRFNGQGAAKSEPPAAVPESLSSSSTSKTR